MTTTLTTPLGLDLEVIEDREQQGDFMVKTFTVYFKVLGYDVLGVGVDTGVLQITAEKAIRGVK